MYNNTLLERFYFDANGVRIVTRTQYVPVITDEVIALLKSGAALAAGTVKGRDAFVRYITNPFMVGFND